MTIDLEEDLLHQSEDQLLLHDTPESLAQELETKEATDQAVADARNKLINYNDLQNFPPFKQFLKDIRSQIDAEFTHMEQTTDPTMLAKRVGAYCALVRISTHTTKEIAEATLFLKAQATKT